MINDLQSFSRLEYSTVKQIMNNPDSIITHFKPSSPELETLVHKLGISVLGGIFEYKRDSISNILTPLESLVHDSRVMESIPMHIQSARALLVTTLLQRLYVLKKIKLTVVRTRETEEPPVETASLKEILEFIKKEVASNPDKIKDPHVKKIMMYSKMYQNEVKKMKDLMVSIPREKKASMEMNFKQSLKSIIVKLNTSYQAINKEANPQGTTKTRQLEKHDYSSAVPLLEHQISSFSQILSTLQYTEKEKFKTREILVNLASGKENYISLIKLEQKKYEEIDPFDKGGKKAGKEISIELVKFFTKEMEWLKLHPWQN